MKAHLYNLRSYTRNTASKSTLLLASAFPVSFFFSNNLNTEVAESSKSGGVAVSKSGNQSILWRHRERLWRHCKRLRHHWEGLWRHQRLWRSQGFVLANWTGDLVSMSDSWDKISDQFFYRFSRNDISCRGSSEKSCMERELVHFICYVSRNWGDCSEITEKSNHLKLTLHMGLEIAQSGEALVAAGAWERFQASVGQKMGLKIAAPTERLAAVDTLVRLYSWTETRVSRGKSWETSK